MLEGLWGLWNLEEFCPGHSYVNGFQSKVDLTGLSGGGPGDYQGLTGLKFRCSDDLVNPTTISSQTNGWGIWDPAGYKECLAGYKSMRAEIQLYVN